MDANNDIKKEQIVSSSNYNRTKKTSTTEEQYAFETVSKNINWDTGIEKIIKENLIIGNYEGAIDCAMKCGRTAEALLIAHSRS